MYTLTQLRVVRRVNLPLVALWTILSASAARGEDFCAVTVNIDTAAPLPPSRTWMELIDDSGRVERREQVQGSTFKICDFGFGPHTLRVGTNDCLPVSVSNLRVVLGRPLHLTVFMNMCGYQENTRTGCFLYLRAVDRHGVPVSDAGLVFPPGMQAYGKTDSYGRLQTLVPRGTTEILLVKDGFGSGKAQSKCSDNEEIDLAVRMEEKAAGSKEH